MVRVRELLVPIDNKGFTSSETLITKTRSFNDSIGIILRSYIRAINKQEELSGSLFRKETKAECLNCLEKITSAFFNAASGMELNIYNPEKEYPQVCFNYIHQNPVKAGLVKKDMDWVFSSAKDYYGRRNGKLINKKITQELSGINLVSERYSDSYSDRIKHD